MIITLLIPSVRAAPWKLQQNLGSYCKTRPGDWLNLQQGVNTKNSLLKRLRSSKLVFNLGFSWKMQMWSFYANPTWQKDLFWFYGKVQLWKEQNLGFVKVEPLSFPAPRWNRDDGRTEVARSDLTEARRARDPSWWRWKGNSRWKTSLDKTFHPNPVGNHHQPEEAAMNKIRRD